ncbi:MAG: ParB/RepB/Spo0J family partition protein [Zhaonellaceae bacterium]|jgi:ParB family chromosome partitioning protein|nr:ParB/RepB/Spo0J family partition protein [Clostridia bacterium]
MAKKGLGKGLGALIPTNFDVISELTPSQESTDEQNRILEISIDHIIPNRYQPRKVFIEEALEELAESIKEHGVVQPIILRKAGKKYELIAGERRWKAAKLAGLKKIPAIVKELSEQETTEIALIENIQREDLNPIEEAGAYQMLLEEFKLTQEELAKKVGKSRPHIANTLRLLNSPLPIQEYIIKGNLTAGHARALLPLPETGQVQLAERIITENLSVRETETIVKGVIALEEEQKKKKKKTRETRGDLSPELIDIEDRLKSYFGTKVRLVNKGQKGKIEIEYYNEDDLTRIIDLLEIS